MISRRVGGAGVRSMLGGEAQGGGGDAGIAVRERPGIASANPPDSMIVVVTLPLDIYQR
jgi:hypothetical protein